MIEGTALFNVVSVFFSNVQISIAAAGILILALIQKYPNEKEMNGFLFKKKKNQLKMIGSSFY